jgi:hypothetical protein
MIAELAPILVVVSLYTSDSMQPDEFVTDGSAEQPRS